MTRGESFTLVAMLSVMGALSQFHRSALGVIAPELAADLGLDPAVLGTANGSFFAALAVLQVPIGLAFDRFGPRRVVSVLTAVAALAAAAHGWVGDPAQLIAVRLLVGAGCAASFMAGVVLTARWFGRARMATMLARVFAASQLGTLAATTPLAWAAGRFGWRASFVAAGLLTAVVGVLWHAWVRDDPPGATLPPRHETLAEVLAGLGAVLRTPGLPRLLALHAFAYAAVAVLMGLWAGPYLHDVYGLGALERGNVVAAMTVAAALGTLAYGPLDRLVGARKPVAMAGAALTIALLLLLALPGLAAWQATLLLVGIAAAGSYSVVLVAHGRSLFADALAGRGVTTVNIAQVLGSALLPPATGAMVAAMPGAAGYRAAFVLVALCLGAGLLVYRTAPEPRPSA